MKIPFQGVLMSHPFLTLIVIVSIYIYQYWVAFMSQYYLVLVEVDWRFYFCILQPTHPGKYQESLIQRNVGKESYLGSVQALHQRVEGGGGSDRNS